MNKLTPKQIKKNNDHALKVVFGVKTPARFTRIEERNTSDGYGGLHTQLTLNSPDIKIRIGVDLNQTYKVYSLGSGHVDFNTIHGWRSFDRRGVADSFYIEPEDTSDTLNEKIEEQIKKATERAQQLKDSVAIPGFPFSCLLPPERVAEIKKDLKKDKVVRLAPSGMGTGYTLTTRRPRERYGWSPAKAETCKFFDAPQLYLISFDHD